MRWKFWIIALIVVGGALLTVAVFRIGPRNLVGLMTYGRQRREGTLQVGHPVPDVTVVALDGVTQRPLGHWQNDKPLVLVFGSFT